MSAVHPAAENPATPEPQSHRPSFVRRLLWPMLVFLGTLVLFVHEHHWVVERIKAADTIAAQKIGEVSIAGLSDDFLRHFQSCSYKAFVICEQREKAACRDYLGRSAVNGLAVNDTLARTLSLTPTCDRAVSACDIALLCNSDGVHGVAAWLAAPIAGLQILPRIPDATLFVLTERFGSGDLFGFALMVLFVGLSLLGIVGTIFSGEKDPVKWAFFAAASGILSPLAVSLGFGLIQLVLLALTGMVGLFLQALLLIGAIPVALLLWLKAGYDARELAEAFKAIGHGK